MATLTPGQMAGIILGSMAGTLFLVTCVISAVKAVKDRRLIKARIQERKRARVLASKLKREGRLGDDNLALSIEDPDFFARHELNSNNSNNHRVIVHSNSCPARSDSNGGLPEPEPGQVTHTQVKRNSEPIYSCHPNGGHPSYQRAPSRGGRRGRHKDLMSVGVYRYKGDLSNGVENAGFEMKETAFSRETSTVRRY